MGLVLLAASVSLGFLVLRSGASKSPEEIASDGDFRLIVADAKSRPEVVDAAKKKTPAEESIPVLKDKPDSEKKPTDEKGLPPIKAEEKKDLEAKDLVKVDPKPESKPVEPIPAEPAKGKDDPLVVGPVTPGLPGAEPEKINRAVLRARDT